MTRSLFFVCLGALFWLVNLAVEVEAACYPDGQQLAPAVVQQVIDNPESLLAQFPNAGGEMISRVRDLVASNPAALQAILSQIANATKDQVNAIGTGLGQAALVCVRTDQAFAGQIQQSVAGLSNGDLSFAFLAVLGDKPIGAVAGGAGGGGGGGGLGGQTSAIPGIGSNPSPGSTSTTTTSTLQSSPANLLSFSSSTSPGSTSATSVSP